MNSSDAPVGIRKDHVLWAAGAIVLSIILFFPSDFESGSNTSATSAEEASTEASAASSAFPTDEGVTTFARSEPVSVAEEEEIAQMRQRMTGTTNSVSLPDTQPVASAAVPRDVFAAGEPYSASASGCGNSAGCDRR